MNEVEHKKSKVIFSLKENKLTFYKENFHKTYIYNHFEDKENFIYKQLENTFLKEFNSHKKVIKDFEDKKKTEIKNCLKSENELFSIHNTKKLEKNIFEIQIKIEEKNKEINFSEECTIDLSEIKKKKYDLSDIF